jgi:repressor LexA
LKDRLRILRKDALELTQQDFANRIGVKRNTIAQYEMGRNIPIDTVIYLICREFNVSEDWLRYGIGEMFVEQSDDDYEKYAATLSDDPLIRSMIVEFGKLDKRERDLFRKFVQKLQSGMEKGSDIEHIQESLMEVAESINTVHATRLINYYYRMASAGTGQVVMDNPPSKKIEIPHTRRYRSVDYAIGVNGNSMEPLFFDGDILLIETVESIEVGDIGIFFVGGESFVKKLGDGELISLNKEFPNIPLTDEAKCFGKVVGKLEKQNKSE